MTILYNLFRTQQQQENGIHQSTWWRVERKYWREMAHEIQLHLQISVRSWHQQDSIDVVDVTTYNWQKGQVFLIPYTAEKKSTLIYNNGDCDNFQGSFLQGRGPSQPKGLPDSQEQNLQVRYPTLPFQANETPFWRKSGVRGLEESAVCHIQKDDDCQRRSTGRHIPDIFRSNPNPISTGSLVINNFYENYFCTFIKNYHYCTYNVVRNERFFAPYITSMKSSKWV